MLLVVESLGVLVWWGMLFAFPATRATFLAPGAPDVTLLVFFPADLFLVGSALLAAAALGRGDLTWLRVHAGAATYASVVAIGLPVLSGSGWLGALLMLPVLALPILLLRALHERKAES